MKNHLVELKGKPKYDIATFAPVDIIEILKNASKHDVVTVNKYGEAVSVTYYPKSHMVVFD